MPFEMIDYLWTKISKITNKDKVQLKKEVFIEWDQPQVLTAHFKQINKACKQLTKWNVKVSDDDIVIHVVDQMYNLDCFSEKNMTNWEEVLNKDKMWSKCQLFFEASYVAKNIIWMLKNRNKKTSTISEADLQMYLTAIEAKTEQDTKLQD